MSNTSIDDILEIIKKQQAQIDNLMDQNKSLLEKGRAANKPPKNSNKIRGMKPIRTARSQSVDIVAFVGSFCIQPKSIGNWSRIRRTTQMIGPAFWKGGWDETKPINNKLTRAPSKIVCSKNKITVCLGSTNKLFSIFIFYAWFGMLSKGMGESYTVQRWASNSQYWWSYGTLNF